MSTERKQGKFLKMQLPLRAVSLSLEKKIKKTGTKGSINDKVLVIVFGLITQVNSNAV